MIFLDLYVFANDYHIEDHSTNTERFWLLAGEVLFGFYLFNESLLSKYYF